MSTRAYPARGKLPLSTWKEPRLVTDLNLQKSTAVLPPSFYMAFLVT